MLFTAWDNIHLPHLHIFTRLSTANQQAGILRIMGQHTLQHWDLDLDIWPSSRRRLTPVPVPRLSDRDVCRRLLKTETS